MTHITGGVPAPSLPSRRERENTPTPSKFLHTSLYTFTNTFKHCKEIYSVLLLVVSNIFMTIRLYGHLKLQEMKLISNWPLFGVILLSWGIALFEYCFQVPANRIGFQENAAPSPWYNLK